MIDILYKLKSILTKYDKKHLFVLLLFSIFISVVETVGVSIIMPFINVSMDFSIIHDNGYFKIIYNFFNFKSDLNFVIFFGTILIIYYIFRSAVNIFYAYCLADFTTSRYHFLTFRLFENYIGMPYKNFVKKNSSELTKSLISESANLTSLISALLTIISELFIVVFLYTIMLYTNYKITLILTIFLLINALLLLKTVSKKIKTKGIERAKIQKVFFEVINKSFGNFKLFKLNSKDNLILDEFEDASKVYANINKVAATLVHIPRFILESIGFVLIIIIILYLISIYENDKASILSILSLFILSLYRLMPSVNRILSGYNTIMFTHKSLDIIHHDLMYECEKLGDFKIKFDKEINLKNITFEYERNKKVLNNINLTIKKGDKIAFIGESGSGKSTLVDLLIGLYKPNRGTFYVDKYLINDDNVKSLREMIGYIPQSVYLFDGTVAQNVALGFDYNEEKVINCLKQAKIYDFLSKKEGIDTMVGEGGIMLSGGQKQRVAIARALYSDPQILVLDEATSALDNETEKQIMNEIYDVSIDKTLIIIAHRLSTIQRCEKIYKLENGRIKLD